MRFPLGRVSQLTLIAVAALVALTPPGAGTVERVYARGLYPVIQSTITPLSNRVPFAVFDVTVSGLVLAMGLVWVVSFRQAKKKQRIRAVGRALMGTVTLLATAYLWFLGAWGFNYARPPLESQVPFDAARITPDAVRALAEHAIERANQTYGQAHAAGFPAVSDVPPRLVAALHQVEHDFGRPRPTVVATPKWTVFTPYYRAAGVSGQLGPFFLETLLNPDLTGPEREATLAHEWAHLSGYAPESEASFIGVLAALRAGPSAEYSAWLDLVAESVNQLQPVTQRVVLAQLAEGPRRDQEAIRERLKMLVAPVERAAWSTYDHMLKSQGVEEGVHSYSRVIQLLIGTDVLKLEPSARHDDSRPDR